MNQRLSLWLMCGALCGALVGCGQDGGDDEPGDDAAADPSMIGGGSGGGAGMTGGTEGTAGTGGSDGTDGSAGTHATDGSAGAPAEPMPDDGSGDMVMEFPDPRGGCPDLDTGFPGDEACIQPPPPGEGMQIHIGPSNYDDEAEVGQFVLKAGDETSQCWSYHTPNAEEVYYQGYVFSGRPGTHHVFNSMLANEVMDGGGFHVCVDAGLGNSSGRIGALPGAGRPYVARTTPAPENAGIAAVVPPNVPAEADMHYFNFTEADMLREFWLNIYFIDKAKVTDTVKGVRGMGGLSWTAVPIPANADQVYKYECPLPANGRLISLQGHFHSHGVRESAWIRRGDGTREIVFEMFDYADQASFSFDSVHQNPPYTGMSDFGYTGILNITAGDVLEWECHIVNGDTPLRYTNSVENGEMCNIFGGFIGDAAIPSCLLF